MTKDEIYLSIYLSIYLVFRLCRLVMLKSIHPQSRTCRQTSPQPGWITYIFNISIVSSYITPLKTFITPFLNTVIQRNLCSHGWFLSVGRWCFFGGENRNDCWTVGRLVCCFCGRLVGWLVVTSLLIVGALSLSRNVFVDEDFPTWILVQCWLSWSVANLSLVWHDNYCRWSRCVKYSLPLTRMIENVHNCIKCPEVRNKIDHNS